MWSAMANADVFGEQLLRHILAFVPRSSELAKQYSVSTKDRALSGKNDCIVDVSEEPADWLADLAAFTQMLQIRSAPWRCPDKDRPR